MTIETERLIIRKFTNQDIDLIFDINNNPECIKFNGWDSMSIENCKETLDKWMCNYSISPGLGAFCVESKVDKSRIGMAFIVKSKEINQYEIGFRLRRIYWDKGYAKEITREFIKYAEGKLGATSVIAEVYKANVRSRSVFEKFNFTEYGHPDGDDGLVYKYEIVKNYH
ncbi:GNAT family N-acetyltransferase [Clostridium estertheticum]|uniref:GNAT family N-acetyltransferase n=1 Tax=Clostridium estertheticum TaxID=238834 RepID=UPI0013E90254|nr:GNAT family N-acetyltransferase [Clostridium estertheticum]MBZ9689711.1 GNAT family N-acetyltransferase [Clostridium estertheticum]